MKKTILIIIGILLVTGIAATGAWYWQNKSKQNINTNLKVCTVKDFVNIQNISQILSIPAQNLTFNLKRDQKVKSTNEAGNYTGEQFELSTGNIANISSNAQIVKFTMENNSSRQEAQDYFNKMMFFYKEDTNSRVIDISKEIGIQSANIIETKGELSFLALVVKDNLYFSIGFIDKNKNSTDLAIKIAKTVKEEADKNNCRILTRND